MGATTEDVEALETRVQPRFLSIESAAAYCDLSTNSIRNMIAAGKITPRRPVRGKILLDRLELDSAVLGSTAVPRRSRGHHRAADS